MQIEMRRIFKINIFLISMILFLLICFPGTVLAQQFFEDWESGQWGDWEQTGTIQTPPSSWTFETGYNSIYSAQTRHYQSYGGWGGWTGLYHTIDFPATFLEAYYYFDRSGNLDFAYEKIVLHLSDEKKVEYWVDTYDYDIPESTNEIKYIDCTGGAMATWNIIQRNILEDIAEFSTGEVIAVEYGSYSRGNSQGEFYGLMRADNILLQAEEDTTPPTVTLDVPNGGEVWTVGEIQQVRWTAEDDMGICTDSVFYSTDNGTSWIFIESHTGNSQGFEWTIPNTPSDNCKVKVIVFDWADNSASDESDECFSIVQDITPPSVTVTSPNGGESWGTFEWHTIAWTAEDNVGVVGDSIYYSTNNGDDWTFIASHTGNPQSFSWQVPDTPSEECLIKVIVYDASGNLTEDISDDNFTICYQEPSPTTYAVVVKNSTYQDPEWTPVVDTLLMRYNGTIFTYETNVWDVQTGLSDYHPTHVGFVSKPLDASRTFINTVHQLMRALDDDPYGDAIWGIITGYNAQDALEIVTGPLSMTISNVILNDCGSLLNYAYQGIYFACHIYNHMEVKFEDGHIETLYGPTDCVDTLVTLLNSNEIDLFMTAGHGNHNEWQRHYPSAGLEGFFRSSAGQLYGDPYSGSDVDVNSINPKIVFNPYTCLIGKISNMNSMVPAWFHTAGAYQYTGYLVTIGYCYNGKGVHEYLWHEQDKFTYSEASYLSNQALLFDQINNTPGVDQGDISYERDEFAFYGDPAGEARLQPVRDPFYSEEFFVTPGPADRDTIMFRITINEDGHPWNYGGNPLFGFPSFDIIEPEMLSTDALNAVVTDNFVLLNVWNDGEPDLVTGETREVIFTCNHIVTDVDEPLIPDNEITKINLYQNYPNPFNPETTISFNLTAEGIGLRSTSPGQAENTEIIIYNIKGQKIKTLLNDKMDAGFHKVIWDGRDSNGKRVSSGIYFYKLKTGSYSTVKKMLLLQ